MRFSFLVFAFFVSTCLFSASYEAVKIGILKPHNPSSVQIIPEQGIYALVVDGQVKAKVQSGERVTFISRGNLVEVRLRSAVLGKYKSPRLEAIESNTFMRLYVLQPRKMERVYDDNLWVSSSASGLKLINHVDLEKYVAGVVESETGKGQTEEFYKVQAVISRTYALNNLRKHLFEGFNLNDQVDCQVYHGKGRWEPLILAAVEATRGKVLVDSEMRMITAAYHSNSGGETVSSESVWSGALPYLRPRLDEFSVGGDHYAWEKSVSKEAWLTYLAREYQYDVSDKLLQTMALNFDQPNRHIYFLDPGFGIPLKELRKDWQLKSTYFNIEPLGADSVKFTGRGFGHGIGLSQEGAMRMSRLGFSYIDILHFYYNDVHVIDLHAIEFFQSD